MSRYIIQETDLVGSITGFPKEVVQLMLDRQLAHTGVENIKVFQSNRTASSGGGGFDWDRSAEGWEFWNRVIQNREFGLVLQYSQSVQFVRKLTKPERWLFDRVLAEGNGYQCKAFFLQREFTPISRAVRDGNLAAGRFKYFGTSSEKKEICDILHASEMVERNNFNLEDWINRALNRMAITYENVVFKQRLTVLAPYLEEERHIESFITAWVKNNLKGLPSLKDVYFEMPDQATVRVYIKDGRVDDMSRKAKLASVVNGKYLYYTL